MPTRQIQLFAIGLALVWGALVHANTQIENVSVDEFKALIDTGEGILLDVRTPDEVAQGKIPGASVLNIYDENFERKLNFMQKDKPIYVYCRSGGRSSQAAKTMSENGFSKVYNLVGGIGAWNKAELPLEKAESVSTKIAPTISPKDFIKTIARSRVALIDFQTQWCAPCKQMEPIIDSLDSEFKGKAAILRIDVDANPQIASDYSVQGVPVFILFVDGEEKWRHSGVIGKEALQERIEREIKG